MLFDKLRIILIGISNIFNLQEAPVEEVKIVDYKTDYVYSEKYAEGEEFVMTNGEYGYTHLVDGESVFTKEPVNKVIQIGTHKKNDYNGVLTGYGPDCPGCNVNGIVACTTADHKLWSLTKDGIVYNDKVYGEVSILAADRTLFPCGTIIEINNSKYKNLIGVVLDTGYTMRRQWRINERVHLDLAFTTEEGTNAVTNKNTNYHVKRWGW